MEGLKLKKVIIIECICEKDGQKVVLNKHSEVICHVCRGVIDV